MEWKDKDGEWGAEQTSPLDPYVREKSMLPLFKA
jgi:hypothetical protein